MDEVIVKYIAFPYLINCQFESDEWSNLVKGNLSIWLDIFLIDLNKTNKNFTFKNHKLNYIKEPF